MLLTSLLNRELYFMLNFNIYKIGKINYICIMYGNCICIRNPG